MRPRYYAYLFLIIIALFAMIGFSSCNIKKDLTKTKEETKTDVEVKTVSTRTVAETIDTNIVIMADTITGTSWDLTTDPIIEQDDNIKLVVTKDKTGQFHATAIHKKEVIPIHKNKLTVEVVNEDKKQKTESLVETKQKNKESESAVKFNMNWIWVIVGAALLVYFAYWFVFVRKKQQDNR